jgi:hypothetical protein
MAHDEGQEDPQLGAKREGLTRTAGRRLADIGMIRFDEVANSLVITDLGRIAAKYYLKHETVEIFSEHHYIASVVQVLTMTTSTIRPTLPTKDERGGHFGIIEHEYRGDSVYRRSHNRCLAEHPGYLIVPSIASQGERSSGAAGLDEGCDPVPSQGGTRQGIR